MAETASSHKSNIVWGLFAVALGAFIIVGTSGLLGIDMHPTEGTPMWIGILAGGVFVAGGGAVILQSLAVARPAVDGSPSFDAPRWVKAISLLLCLLITAGLGSIALWIAFGSGPRQFGGGGTFIIGHVNEIFGRVMFGFGGLLTVVIFFVFLFDGVRRLRR